MARKTLTIQDLLELIRSLEYDALWDLEETIEAAITVSRPTNPISLDNIRRALRSMPLGSLERARDALNARRIALANVPKKPKNKPLQVKESGGWTLQLEHVQCGKACAHCPHGPYWYGYRSVDGRTKKKYFGRDFPTGDKLAAGGVLGKDAVDQAEALPKKAGKR